MARYPPLLSLLVITTVCFALRCCHAAASFARPSTSIAATDSVATNDKIAFLSSLDSLDSLNAATSDRTDLLNRMISNRKFVRPGDLPTIAAGGKVGFSVDDGSAPCLKRPGSVESFLPVAPGSWYVVYAPHMTTLAGLAGGTFRVRYDLNDDLTMESHAMYDFPLLGRGYLSVSGTYGSEDGGNVCRVDFDEAWVRVLPSSSSSSSSSDASAGANLGEAEDCGPYASINDVPESAGKALIRNVGRALFIREFSVFPVSFLDDNLIVFDFELLGTRICARKVQ